MAKRAMFGQISYWAFRDGLSGRRNVFDAIQLAKEAGFTGIELCVSEEGDVTPDTPTSRCREIAEAAREAGLAIGSVASGLLWKINPASAKKDERRHAVELTRRCMRVTADLGAKLLLVLPGNVDVFFDPAAAVVPYDLCYERAVRFGRAIMKHATRYGVTACFENVWNKFLLSPLDFRRYILDIKHGRAAVYFDVGNVWNFGYPQHWIRILGRRIKAIHVKDFKRSVGNVSGFCQLLDGDVPLAESLRMMQVRGYRGPVTAEIFPGPGDEDEKAFLRTTCERLQKILPKARMR